MLSNMGRTIEFQIWRFRKEILLSAFLDMAHSPVILVIIQLTFTE